MAVRGKGLEGSEVNERSGGVVRHISHHDGYHTQLAPSRGLALTNLVSGGAALYLARRVDDRQYIETDTFSRLS